MFLEFIFSDERQTFKNAETQSDKAHLDKLWIIWKLKNKFWETYQEKYSELQQKESHIKSITESIVTLALMRKRFWYSMITENS